MKILVTGNAGFIGFHVARRLLERGDDVIGFDSINDYYDPQLKHARLAELEQAAAAAEGDYRFIRDNLADAAAVNACFESHRFDRVIHLAAQAGVRHSLEKPLAYVEANIAGFTNILEACRHNAIEHLTYASTSSVYGANTNMPFSEHHGVDHPLQFYAATKRANELMAHAYSHLFRLPTTGLRFFTVYGPWSRPDMAPMLFARAICEGRPIEVFNDGNHSRDFTYVDDIVEGVVRANDHVAEAEPGWSSVAPDAATSDAPFRIYNIGNNRPVRLLDFIAAMEKALGRKADIRLAPPQPGDVPDTWADVTELNKTVGYAPETAFEAGIVEFASWFRSYHEQH